MKKWGEASMSKQSKVLLIDDDSIDRQMYRRYIEAFPDEKFSILEFETGYEGLDYCSQHEPSCIFLDYNLPDLNGLEFLEKLNNSSIPIIMLTGQGDETVAVEAMKMGVQDYLVKDKITPTYLMSSIKNSIKICQLENQRKQAEEALIQANEKLENKVRERTASLVSANAKLLAAKEHAESANQAKSIFLSKMSHELRTPLHAILGFTQLLQMDQKNPLSDYQQKNMKSVTEAGNHLLDLINEVLDLSKIESEKSNLLIETHDAVPIVESVIEISKPLAEKKGIQLIFDSTSDKTCFVDVDSLRFKQVVFNLISNAIKFNKPKGSVIVSCHIIDEEVLRLSIRDTGVGIAKSDQNKIFKPFERLENQGEFIEGAGIGLAICKQLIESMNGNIDLESNIGEGSVFHICIPFSETKSNTPEIGE